MKMKRILFELTYHVILSFSFYGAAVAKTCSELITIHPTANPSAIVYPDSVVREIESTFFGFNLEWLEFQRGLWDSSSKDVHQDLPKFLKPFSGAVYRFPGGHHSNHISWRDSIGPLERRPLKRQVDWMPSLRVEFGLSEYLDFLRQVNGVGWYVLNMFGRLNEIRPIDELSIDAKDLAAYVDDSLGGASSKIRYWELGNELDRAEYRWKPSLYVSRAKHLARSVSSVLPNAKFVHLQQEYPTLAGEGLSANEYNEQVRRGLGQLDPDYSMHAYYDGPPIGPPVTYFLKQVCKVIEAAKQEDVNPKVWITEHARIPTGAFDQKDWKSLWPGTSDHQAALSVADMTIALASVPEVKGAFVHALHASGGPWPMLRRSKSGSLEATLPFQSLTTIREAILPFVLYTKQHSPYSSAVGDNPSIRSLVMRDASSKEFSVVIVNRSDFQVSQELLGLPEGTYPVSVVVQNSLGVERVNPNATTENKTDKLAGVKLNTTRRGLMITIPRSSLVVVRMSR